MVAARLSARRGAGGLLATWPAQAMVCGYAVSMIAGVVAIVQGRSVPAVTAPTMGLFGLLGLVLAVRCWRHGGLGRRTRQAWAVMSVAFLLMLVFPVLFGVFGAERYPSPGDVLRWAFTLVLFTGLLRFPVGALSGTERRKIGLDVATVVVGGFTALWYLVIGPGITSTAPSVRAVAAASAYPTADLVLIFGLATVLLRGTDPAIRRPLTLLAAGSGCFLVADTYLGYVRSHGLPMEVIDSWPLLVYLTAHFLFALAAYDQYRHPRGGVSRAGRQLPVFARLPHLAVALAYGLMLVAAGAEHDLFPWSGLVLGGVGITAVVMTRQVLVQRESHHLATTDGLTGLANRLQFHQALHRAAARAERTGQTFAVVLADMNGFKAVNDTLGHNAGDQLLVEFAALLRRCVLGSDVVGRLGGDEFALVLHKIKDPDGADTVVRRILAEMRHPATLAGSRTAMGASFGIAVSRPGETDPDELLHRADLAMYQAKRVGGSAYSCYDPTMSDGDRARFEEELRRAPAAGQLRVHYQPILSLADGRVLGVEALVRWEHPERGLLPPAEFIGVAEQTGVIAEIGAWVLEQACSHMQRWQQGLGEQAPTLSVDISTRQLESVDFAATVLEILRRTGFPARRLTLELTQAAPTDEAASTAQLETLGRAGVLIAFDDFGSRYSSLRRSTRRPAGRLKPDRSFAAGLDGATRGSAVAEAVLRLSHALQLETIPAGAEDDDARALALLGYHAAQGYQFSRPLPPEALDAFLRHRTAADPPTERDADQFAV